MFSAGGDLRSIDAAGERAPQLIREICENFHAAFSKFANMDAPLVAAVNGTAAGAGMSLVAVADIALAAESASFCLASATSDLDTQLEAESNTIVAITDTRDSREGVQAFLEKRKPIFRGE